MHLVISVSNQPEVKTDKNKGKQSQPEVRDKYLPFDQNYTALGTMENILVLYLTCIDLKMYTECHRRNKLDTKKHLNILFSR